MKQSPLMYLVFLCLLFSNCEKDVSPVVPVIEQEIDPKVAAFTDNLTALYNASVLPGFAVTVVKEETILYQNAFGQANVEQDVKYTNQTTQPIGSISKTFIGLALMKAIEQGHFTLATPINDILPFEVINPHFPNESILIKHLVTHTSSFEDSEETYDSNYYIKTGENVLSPTAKIILDLGISVSDGIPLGDYLAAVFPKEGALYDEDNFGQNAPGTAYDYSNIAASLAAYLIEVKTGQSYASYVKANIFDPLGMKNSAFDRSELDQNNLATLYLSKEYAFPEYSHPSYPDGFISSSNEDMVLYLIEMIKGVAGKGTLLSKESYQLLFERQTQMDVEFDDDEIHAVFWELTDDARIQHTGGDPGVIAYLSFNPITSTGYFIMSNINDNGLGGDLGVDGSIAFDQLIEVFQQVNDFVGTE